MILTFVTSHAVRKVRNVKITGQGAAALRGRGVQAPQVGAWTLSVSGLTPGWLRMITGPVAAGS